MPHSRPMILYGTLLRSTTRNCSFYSTSKGKEGSKKKDVQDTSRFEVLSMTLHDILADGSSSNAENQSVELIVPRYSNKEGTEQLPIYNDVYFEPIEHEMNDLIFKIQRDIVNYNRWIVTAKPTAFDTIDVTMLPYAEGKFCITKVFTKPEYHRDFMESFNQSVEGLHYDASSTDKRINVQNLRSADLQKVVEQLRKGNSHKVIQISPPGTQLMKKRPAPKPPANSKEAEQDISQTKRAKMIYRLSHTMEATGAALAGGHMLQAMEQGCDLMFIDHGQRHGLRLVQEQMEALVDTGYSAFVERLIAKNDILDQQFLHFPFVVLLNKKILTTSGRASISNVSDKEGLVYIRAFTHMTWAVQHIQYCELKASEGTVHKKEGENTKPALDDEEMNKQFDEQKGKLQKVLSKRKKKDGVEPKVEETQKGGDGKMYTCTRLTGYQLLKMVQRAPKQITGGIMINNGVSKNLCTVAHNVTVKTEEILEWDLDTAFTSDPVHRPYQ